MIYKAHVAGWEPSNLHDRAHIPWVGSVLRYTGPALLANHHNHYAISQREILALTNSSAVMVFIEHEQHVTTER